MPMNGDLLAQEIAAKFGNPPTQFMIEFCKVIIEHIQKYGVVNNVVVTGASATGGPVTGVGNLGKIT